MTDTELDNSIRSLLTTGGRSLSELIDHANSVNQQLLYDGEKNAAPQFPAMPQALWGSLKNWLLNGNGGKDGMAYAVDAFRAIQADDQQALLIATFCLLKAALNLNPHISQSTG